MNDAMLQNLIHRTLIDVEEDQGENCHGVDPQDMEGFEVFTFEEAGVMSRNKGVVVSSIDKDQPWEYQVTIVRSR